MVSRVQALNYRCLRHVDVGLGNFHILVGPNASGKSTFLDVVGFIRDILQNGPEAAVRSRAQTLQELSWKRETQGFQMAIELRVPDSVLSRAPQNGRRFPCCRYEIEVGVEPEQGGIQLLTENFFLLPESPADTKQTEARDQMPLLFPAEPQPPATIVLGRFKKGPSGWRRVISLGEGGRATFKSETTEWNFPQRVAGKAALVMVPEEERFPVTVWAREVLRDGVQMLSLNSRAMREPCRPDVPFTFRPDGSNLPVVLRRLRQSDERRFGRWLEHVQSVLPLLKNIHIREREVDRFPFLVAEYGTGIEVPSWLLSDGTLRLLALTLLAYLPGPSGVYLVEEPENGIHPKAVEAVHESLSSVYEGQVLCATHSPLFLSLAKLTDLLCFAQAESGATSIVRGDEHPALRAWKGQVALETLYAAGVLG